MRNTILGQDIRIYEPAGRATVEVLLVILGLCLAGIDTAVRTEGLAVIPDLLGDVRVAGLVCGGADGGVVEVYAGVAGDGVVWWVGLRVWRCGLGGGC